jgi:hypothetical protein
MVRLLFFVFFTLMLTACAGMRGPVDDVSLLNIKRVGVASVLGTTFNGVSIGTTVFNNNSYKAEVPDWKIDNYASNSVINIIRNGSEYEVSKVVMDGKSVAQLVANQNEALLDMASNQKFDIVVMIYPSASENVGFVVPGYGMYERSMFSFGRRCIYTAYVLTVWDVVSRKQLGWQWAGNQDLPCKKMESDYPILFKPRFDDYSSDEKRLIRSMLEAQLDWSLGESISAVHLIHNRSQN